ncbi:MAG: pyruvate, phosphate dikinase [Alphaproteobacteria bacterium]
MTDSRQSGRRWVYGFGPDGADGQAAMADLLGGKGANLAEMANLGLPVPPGFTITTEACRFHDVHDGAWPPELDDQITQALQHLESQVGSRFGEAGDPLLVSVRSGARVSMPGMMDTVLNLGLNDSTVEDLARHSGNRRFAFDSYRRFIQMYGDVVLGVSHYNFEDLLERLRDERGVSLDTDLGAEDLAKLVGQYKALIEDSLGRPFPQSARDQLREAINAVFRSWGNQRAQTYRRLHGISDEWGTAVTVQAMVFGNMGDDCATGVAFTRDPGTGENAFYGEYLVNAQGEDVVAGIRTPQNLTRREREASGGDQPSLEEAMPDIYRQLVDVRDKLERHYRDMQDIEFTVQKDRLWMLQTRSGKRTAAAALRIAVEMADDGIISRPEAVCRVDPASLDQLLHPTLDPAAEKTIIARGLPASPGAASGAVVLTADEAESRAAAGESVILVRVETSPEDIHGMHAAKGILTTRGGMTSHAAVVARGMGRPCVSGAGEVWVDLANGTMGGRGVTVRAGETITIDGVTGEVMVGEVATIEPQMSGHFDRLMAWADESRRLKVRTNADTPADCRTARRFGAEGIGLCRTEHMFFDAERIVAVREMIMAHDQAGRRRALAKIEPMQRADFRQIFEIMENQPVTIRLLDPPLHEFLPKTDDDMAAVAGAMGLDMAAVRARRQELSESNPMLGHRGCRLGISFPEIYEMQVRAIMFAAADLYHETGQRVHPEIMVPLVATRREMDILKEVIDRTAAAVVADAGEELTYEVGTMIELPRAVLRAGSIAEAAVFFSFGTNDLTQTTFGISRDDAGRFIDEYRKRGVFGIDPFISLDIEGVGELIRMGTERGRATRPDLKVGICGEHGGDPASIAFCHEVGLDYVSCSPYRVPIARLAAAQAALGGCLA